MRTIIWNGLVLPCFVLCCLALTCILLSYLALPYPVFVYLCYLCRSSLNNDLKRQPLSFGRAAKVRARFRVMVRPYSHDAGMSLSYLRFIFILFLSLSCLCLYVVFIFSLLCLCLAFILFLSHLVSCVMSHLSYLLFHASLSPSPLPLPLSRWSYLVLSFSCILLALIVRRARVGSSILPLFLSYLFLPSSSLVFVLSLSCLVLSLSCLVCVLCTEPRRQAKSWRCVDRGYKSQWSYLVLSYLVFSYLVLSFVVLSCLALPCLILPCRIVSCIV